VDSRQHLKALQAHVAAARTALDAGDRNKALQNIDQALSIDPSFLAAQLLRERVLAAPLASSPVPPAATKAPARRFASREAYERIELRAKQRRIDHCIAATRAALGRQQPEAAAASLAELIALEPHETNVASLSAELADLRRRFSRRPFGVRLAAASAFLAVAGTASWLERPRQPAHLVAVTTTAERTTAPVETTPKSVDVAAASTPAEVDRKTEDDKRQSRLAAAPEIPTPPAPPPPTIRTVPDTPRRVPDTPSSIPATSRSVPAPAAARTATTTTASTAPMSLPVPLSQLPPAGAPAQHEPPAAAITTGPPVAMVAPVRPPTDQELVEEALQRYRRAYGRLNVQSAQAVYPTVNRVALARAFDNLESQLLTFDSCDVELRGTLARAICHGTTHYVPKVGSRYPRTEPLVWSFELRKSDGDWTIDYAKASR
jgi:tetratricopeptide (TPR) repeat protein